MFPGTEMFAGAEFRVFCSFNCTNEASGEITVDIEVEDGTSEISLPICPEHAVKFLGQGYVELPAYVDNAAEE